MLNLDKNHNYLLACSYGPDSMALFDMLKKEGYKFSVAHVNYNLREESIDEELKLRGCCATNHKIIFVRNVKKSEYKGNIEACCRNIRYEYFKNLVEQYGFDAVLVAHHQDDLIETYLMQKQRKSLPDYYGIKEQNIIDDAKIIRPLLSYSKQYLLKYCKENNVPYSIDSTNLENSFTRNKIRHSIVEKMSDEERKKVLSEIEKLNKDNHKIREELLSNDLESIHYLNRLKDKELSLAIILSGRKIKENFDCSKRQVLEIKKILKSSKPNIMVNVKGVHFVKRYDRFVAINEKEEVESFSYTIEEPSKFETEFFFLDFRGGAENRNVLPSSYPLTIRNAQPHDTYQIKNYQKTVRRLFIDWKMPTFLRKRWPLIVDKNNKVIYIPRYKANFVAEENCNFYVKY